MAKDKIIGVELIKLEYAPVPASGLPTSWTELEFVHEETYRYNQGEPTTDPYRDVKGNVYHTDITAGETSMEAVIGKYDLKTKQEFQGGTYTPATASSGATWTPPETPALIHKAIRGTTKDGVVITFPKAQIVANATENKKAIGQAIRCIPVKPDDSALSSEIWNDGIKTA